MDLFSLSLSRDQWANTFGPHGTRHKLSNGGIIKLLAINIRFKRIGRDISLGGLTKLGTSAGIL